MIYIHLELVTLLQILDDRNHKTRHENEERLREEQERRKEEAASRQQEIAARICALTYHTNVGVPTGSAD